LNESQAFKSYCQSAILKPQLSRKLLLTQSMNAKELEAKKENEEMSVG